MLISRNRLRQGAPSEEDEGVDFYVDSSESRSNEVLDDLYNQHRIAKRKESILLLHRRFVSVHNELLACEGADEHYESAFGEVEIGYKSVYRLELISRVDEDGGLAVYRVDLAVGSAYALQNSARGGAYGNDSTALGAALVYLFSNLVGDVEVLTVHKVLLYLVHLYRAEGAETYVQSNLAVANALSFDSLEKLRSEV